MILPLIVLAAQAAEPTAQSLFSECAALAQTRPEQGVDAANSWLVQGGGLEARQCLALAYAAQERWAPAATVYEQAAREAQERNDPRRARYWYQAGNAWVAADEPERAVQAFDSALASPNVSPALRGQAHLDRARALVAAGNPAGARVDLDLALRQLPLESDAWFLSAALAARQRDLPRARAEIARATELAPDNADILLLAGTIAGLSGDGAEAERLYRRVVQLAPDSEAGQAAGASLATIREVEVEAPAPDPA